MTYAAANQVAKVDKPPFFSYTTYKELGQAHTKHTSGNDETGVQDGAGASHILNANACYLSPLNLT